MRISQAIGYREGVATYTGNLAALALDRKDWPGAEARAREALSMSEKVGRQELIAASCQHLATALARQGRKHDALQHARRAEDIYVSLGSPSVASVRAILRECES